MTEQFANFAQTTLNGNISATQATITLASLANFPASYPYRIVVTTGTGGEIMLVTGLASGTTLNVTRGYEGTQASPFNIGALVANVATAGILSSLWGAFAGLGTAATQAVSSATGTVAAVAGTTTAGHVAIFSNTSGTVEDGGPPSSGSAGPPGVLLSVIGDSEMANAFSIVGQQTSTINAGAQVNAQILSGRRIQSPIANNHAVGGTNWGQILATVPTALADNPDFLLMDGGTNDAAQGIALNTTINNMYAAVRQALAAGVIPILCPITPRTYGYTTAIGQFIESYNQVLQELGYGRADLVTTAGLPLHKYPIVLDVSDWWNYTGTAGACNPGFVGNDGLHWQWGGGLNFGAQIAAIVSQLRGPAPTWCTSPYDIYNAASLTNGNLLNAYNGSNDGMLQGSGGYVLTQHGVTPTGTVANGWEAYCSSASSSGTTMTLSQQNPRTDGLISGVRQRIQITQGTGGSGVETFSFGYLGGGAAIASNIAAGDTVVFECRVQVNSATNLVGIQALLGETGPASPQQFADGVPASNAQIGLNSAQFPQMLNTMVLRTPPMTLQSGITRLTPSIIITLYVGSYAVDLYVSDCAVRKVVAS
jgi:hypothetical protein